jgi:SPP1 gp7 family putative phage head morphogenesis protein
MNPTGAQGGEWVPMPGLPERYPDYLKPIPVNTRDIVGAMRGHLNAAEPKVQRWLYSTWTAEREAIKYQELRNAVRDSQVPAKWIQNWQLEYADFVNERLAPQWEDSMVAASGHLTTEAARQGIAFTEELSRAKIREWIGHRGGELIVYMRESQYRAVRNVLLHYTSGPDAVGPRELGRIIRPIIGLTPKQATAVKNYRDSLMKQVAAGDMTKKRATHLVGNYSGYLHRIRAERIARTETAFAYNRGMFEQMRQARDTGVIKNSLIVKEFLTAADERVCPHCGPLDGETIELEQTFPGATQRLPNLFTPPLHPSCRCAVVYSFMKPKKNA